MLIKYDIVKEDDFISIHTQLIYRPWSKVRHGGEVATPGGWLMKVNLGSNTRGGIFSPVRISASTLSSDSYFRINAEIGIDFTHSLTYLPIPTTDSE